ncbi:hypothetical protein GCM10010328_65200 [Streptomyces rubiginosohelvolus]|uniref:Uncharacterized protein n=1 Tax=Streptomyces rubiginosohelvolus TaxID=67362 RepID=A0ABQ3CEU1_9ACTN|nr:hypothetical protein GCM10010328_65200 [Streptomyces pluricolorescens]
MAGVQRVVEPRIGQRDGPGQPGVRLAVQRGGQVPARHRVGQPLRDPERRRTARESAGLREPRHVRLEILRRYVDALLAQHGGEPVPDRLDPEQRSGEVEQHAFDHHRCDPSRGAVYRA